MLLISSLYNFEKAAYAAFSCCPKALCKGACKIVFLVIYYVQKALRRASIFINDVIFKTHTERNDFMSKFSYTPHGVCSVQIDFEIDDGIVHNIHFTRGCNGNTQGVARLAEGMKVDDVIARLKGLNCNGRGTSCPDQLATALELAKEQM